MSWPLCMKNSSYTGDKINFWRTQDKKEIDFILKSGKTFLPLEVKINFSQFQFAAVKYFLDKYKLREFKLIALKGSPMRKNYIYPWQI